MKLRVMTYNIRWGLGLDGQLDLQRTAGVIAAAAPDLVGLQEVERGSPRSRFCDQPAELSRLLGMHVAFGPNLRLGSWQFGNALLSRHPIRRWRNVALPVPPLSAGEEEECGHEPCPRRAPARLRLSATALLRRWAPTWFDRRGVIAAEVEVAEGAWLYAFVTHLPLRQRSRLLQMEAILELVAGAGERAMLMGDFNEGPEGLVFARLRRDGGLTNVSGDEPTFPSDSPSGKIDFILAAGAIRAVGEPRVLPSSASDHRPLVVEIELG